jgi:hypothetical protein
MAEYIERIDTFSDKMCEGIDCGVCPFYNKAGENDCQVVAFLRSIPAADVRPVVRGKWIDRDDDYYGWNMWACSACGEEFVLTDGTPDMNEYHFCPNCGADMREKS